MLETQDTDRGQGSLLTLVFLLGPLAQGGARWLWLAVLALLGLWSPPPSPAETALT